MEVPQRLPARRSNAAKQPTCFRGGRTRRRTGISLLVSTPVDRTPAPKRTVRHFWAFSPEVLSREREKIQASSGLFGCPEEEDDDEDPPAGEVGQGISAAASFSPVRPAALSGPPGEPGVFFSFSG